ncbi:DMT family transporter [Microvirga puerhi]|uniref:DMT family transporter n=1 Tax=Microvirga puerhi TaxID=2876078 RepID=A0ABS7VH25_9HYPH|nr:DMT family transporter [Microvirga puerhi]MBZ6074803.1 DMT family transporter [Microvirga puerhi]
MTDALHGNALSSRPSVDRRALLGWSAGLVTVIIWAFWMVGTRHAVTHQLPPAAVGIVRFAVPAVVLAPFVWRVGLWPKGLPVKVGLGLLCSGAPFFLIAATGMQYAPAADIGPLLPGTMPLFVALIGWLVFGEKLGGLRLLGFALILAADLCVAGQSLFQTGTGAWRGHLLLLSGACLWGIYTHAYRRSGLTALQAAGLIGLWSVLLLLPFGAAPLIQAASNGLLGSILIQALLQGFLSGVVAIVLYGYAIDRLGPSRAAALSPLGPVLAALLAIPMLNEIPSLAATVGIAFAALGVVLASGILAPKVRAARP